MSLWRPNLVQYWLICNTLLPLISIPITFWFLRWRKQARLLPLLSDGQLCLYGCAISSSAIYDISRHLWQAYKNQPASSHLDELLLSGLSAIGFLALFGLFFCGGTFVVLTYISVTSKHTRLKRNRTIRLSRHNFYRFYYVKVCRIFRPTKEQELSYLSISVTIGAVALVIFYRRALGVI